MNLKQAQYIKTIAQCGSLTAAARKLYVSQPSLSQMLHQIEKEAGISLFDRSTSPLRPTLAGRKYLHTAEIILAANAELEEQLREIRGDRVGLLRLGISVTRAMQVLPQVISLFAEQYPNVQLDLTETGSRNLEALLQDGSINLALAALEPTSVGIAYELIEQEQIGILAGRSSLTARSFRPGTPLSLAQAAGDCFVSLRDGHSVRAIQDQLFRQLRLSPHILLETDTLEVGRRVALEAGACMILPNIYIDDYVRQKQGSYYPLRDYENHRHFYACYRDNIVLPRYAYDFIQITASVLRRQREKTLVV